MISIVADTHTHTLACDHAYSTITENAAAAAKKGLKFLVMTEHAPAMEGAPSRLYFFNLPQIPRLIDGVMILKGAEVNIIDYQGSIDLPDSLTNRLEWVIASYHLPCIAPGTVAAHTNGWMQIAHNPLIDVIGHCGDSRYAFEQKTVIREFAAGGKVVEINAHSFEARPGSIENCRQIALLCAEYEVPVVVSSDAHYHTMVGKFDHAISLLEDIGFPHHLILNADYQRFLAAAQERSGKPLID